MSRPARDPIERFWGKVNKNGPPPPHLPELGPCWLWTDVPLTNGYGQFTLPGNIRFMAHVYAYRVVYDKTMVGPLVLHRCDIRLCIREDHLWSGTHQDNFDDMVRKDRQAYPGSNVYGNATRGEAHPNAKLTDEAVVDIFMRHREGWAQQRIAKRHGISQPLVGMILRRVVWRHVSVPDHTGVKR